MIATLRTLTRKSKLNFGKFKEDTVQQLLDRRKHIDLIAAYYKLSAINFTEDVLEELKIYADDRIQKPSINKEKYYLVLDRYPGRYRNKEIEKMVPKTKAFKKSYLQAKNHGR